MQAAGADAPAAFFVMRRRKDAPQKLEIPEGHKACTGCGRIWPADTEHFERDGKKRNGEQRLSCHCKECIHQDDKIERTILAAKTDKALALAGMDLIDKQLALRGDVPHSAHIVEAIYTLCGGPYAYAEKVWQQYEAAEQGSYGRTRILELVARLTVQNSSIGGAQKPAELMTDEELAAERKRLVLEVFQPEATHAAG